ncbi:MAG: class IV adenylate cyclase [Thermodesulfobacteriota bacterium]
MALEKELKFPCKDFSRVRQRLSREKAVFLDSYFECNQVFDTPDRGLKQKDILLRLREGNNNVLCLKRSPGEDYPPDIKVWEEFETDLQSPEQMRSILYALGYVIAFCYDKIREKWSLRGCKVCLDLVPFDQFVEIEGEIEEIELCAALLGLDMQTASTKTYQQLNREYRLKNGLPESDSFVFQEPERSKLIEKGSIF